MAAPRFFMADAVSCRANAKLSQLPSADRDPASYRALYGRARERSLAVSRETARLLYVLTRAARARTVVEFGTLEGSELEPHKAARAREHLASAGLDEGVEIREGEALETLARALPERIDLVLLDGGKVLYPRILRLLEPRLPQSALVVVDNMDMSPELAVMLRDDPRYLDVPFGRDVSLVLRTGL